MRKAFTLLSFITFMVTFARAQDLTGVWQGHFRSTNLETRSTVFDDRYKFEVQIAQHDKKFEAVTYSYLSSIFYGKADAKGTVNPSTGKVLLQEGKLIELRMADGGGPCVMTCFLQYSKDGDEEFLEGSYGSMNIRDSTNCGRGTVFLRKVATSDFYTEPFVAKREKEIDEEKTAPPKSPVASKDIVKNNPAKKPLKKPVTAANKPATHAPATAAVTNKPNTHAPATAANKPPVHAPRTDATAGNTPHPSTHKPATAPNKPPATKEPAPAKEPAPIALSKVNTEKPATGNPPIHTDANVQGHVDASMIPDVLLSRSNELVRTITTGTNEITLNIYDDGVIDHDTVSVFVDKQMVVAHRMLTDKAIVVKLHLDETKSTHEVVMVADNEGDIPPNTSLMIVKAGDQQFEVRISSNEQKNAVVVFKYVKDK